MSLGRNIAANYASQFYVSIVGLLVLPLYLRHLGPEAYGLVGFFMLLQSWFMLLDLGLTPTIGREMARHHGGAMEATAFRRLFRALALIFTLVAVVGGGALWLLARPIAEHWLDARALSTEEVAGAVHVMAACVALRWMCGLYRGVVTGSERLVWLGGYNATMATLRFVGVLPVMARFGGSVEVFFTYQLLVGCIEFAWIGLMARRLLPVAHAPIGWSFAPVRPLLRFSLSIAFTSTVWVLVTQTDRLVLSGILSLSEYGYFSLAVLVASGIMLVGGPVSSAIMPRMSRLHAEGREDSVVDVYRVSTQWVAIAAGSVSVTLACCPEAVLLAWTGDSVVAASAGQVLRLYAIGNGLLAVAAFPFYLQYARGNLRLHLIGNAVTVVVLLPAIVWAAQRYGAVGAGVVWLATNAFFLVFWVAYVHRRLVPGLHLPWLLHDVGVILACALVVPLAIVAFAPPATTRFENLLLVLAVASTALAGAVAGSAAARGRLRGLLSGRRAGTAQ